MPLPVLPRGARPVGRLASIPLLTVAALVVLAGCVSRPVPPPGNKVVFGLGPAASGARTSRLGRETSLGMYSTWYNGPGDLAWLREWADDEVPNAYRAGKAHHLIVWTGDAETTFATKYGTACGRPYPLSSRFLSDMTTLAKTFAGATSGPPLYVTLFTELQTYPCTDNQWNPNAPTNVYLRALKDRYVEARNVFRQHAPNARVSLGWGGWQAEWDAPATGGGRSMIGNFADVMTVSDFQSVQAMANTSSVAQVSDMTAILGRYGPVMVAHFKPDNVSQATFDADVARLFTDTSMAGLKRSGLFAFSFMDSANLGVEASYQRVKAAVLRYGVPA